MTEVFCDSRSCGYWENGQCSKAYIMLKGETCDDYVEDDEDDLE